MHIRRIPETPVPGKPLGRHVRHDPRSLAYQIVAGPTGALVSIRHKRYIPVLDQLKIGACTGNGAEGNLGTGQFLASIPVDHPARPTGDALTDEAQAVALYSAATRLDDYQGEYPPEDTGSDGLSVAKACVAAGLISGYQHATSLEAALTALASGPIIAGINWYDSFDQPDANGVIRIGKRAKVRGGHEICIDQIDVENQMIEFPNSWGESYGVKGRARMSWGDFARLLSEDGDVTVFVPVTSPAPTPTPPQPAPSGCLAEVISAITPVIGGVLKRYGL